jgi:hypothetical protein
VLGFPWERKLVGVEHVNAGPAVPGFELAGSVVVVVVEDLLGAVVVVVVVDGAVVVVVVVVVVDGAVVVVVVVVVVDAVVVVAAVVVDVTPLVPPRPAAPPEPVQSPGTATDIRPTAPTAARAIGRTRSHRRFVFINVVLASTPIGSPRPGTTRPHYFIRSLTKRYLPVGDRLVPNGPT